MYRTEGPAYVITKVQLRVEIMNGATETKATFSDNEDGGKEAASLITNALKRDDWELEKVVLGYMILVPKTLGE
jgi:hypothetical protein